VNDYNNARQIEAGSADSQIQRDQEGQTGKHGDGLVDPWVMKKPREGGTSVVSGFSREKWA
jgi:hypothetical protein